MEPISSTDNPHVRLLRALQDARGRARHRAFLVEGVRLVETAALAARPRVALHAPRFGAADGREAALLRRLTDAGAEVRAVTERVLAHVSDTVTPQGIVAAVPLPEPVPDQAPTLAVVLDGIGDPGNAGTLLRTAAAVGVERLLCAPQTVDVYAPKVVRAAAGAHFAVEIRSASAWADVTAALASVEQVVLADARVSRRYWDVDWSKRSALIVSNEAHGASAGAREIATTHVGVPMAPGIESLNAAVAGSVILYEALRQRISARETETER